MKSQPKIEWYFRDWHDSSEYGVISYVLTANVETDDRSGVTYRVDISTDNRAHIELDHYGMYGEITPNNCKIWLKDAALIKKRLAKIFENTGSYLFQRLDDLGIESDKLSGEINRSKYRLAEQYAELYRAKDKVGSLEHNIASAENRAEKLAA